MNHGFGPGDRVRVRDEKRPGHVRTPDYLKGKPGQIAAAFGEFRNPERLAYGEDGLPEKTLYKVGFRQVDLWDAYGGAPDDTLYVDIFEHWLEPRLEPNREESG